MRIFLPNGGYNFDPIFFQESYKYFGICIAGTKHTFNNEMLSKFQINLTYIYRVIGVLRQGVHCELKVLKNARFQPEIGYKPNISHLRIHFRYICECRSVVNCMYSILNRLKSFPVWNLKLIMSWTGKWCRESSPACRNGAHGPLNVSLRTPISERS